MLVHPFLEVMVYRCQELIFKIASYDFHPLSYNIPINGPLGGPLMGTSYNPGVKNTGISPISDYFFRGCHHGLKWKPRLPAIGFILRKRRKWDNARVCLRHT